VEGCGMRDNPIFTGVPGRLLAYTLFPHPFSYLKNYN
jgi:hypothetical protein